mmetsp:Transcript_20299/g.51403  ORF Transcript_20299/g.51403 Transcript_20299/m.51403 type:complete len:213 (-) Transcript_20299:371-1009(-)
MNPMARCNPPPCVSVMRRVALARLLGSAGGRHHVRHHKVLALNHLLDIGPSHVPGGRRAAQLLRAQRPRERAQLRGPAAAATRLRRARQQEAVQVLQPPPVRVQEGQHLVHVGVAGAAEAVEFLVGTAPARRVPLAHRHQPRRRARRLHRLGRTHQPVRGPAPPALQHQVGGGGCGRPHAVRDARPQVYRCVGGCRLGPHLFPCIDMSLTLA